jgi:hypothetical protein
MRRKQEILGLASYQYGRFGVERTIHVTEQPVGQCSVQGGLIQVTGT